MGDPITYASLRNRQKEEDGPQLTRLDADFYRRARAAIDELKAEYETALRDDPSSQRTLVLQDEMTKMRETLTELYHRRERKVVLAALTRARGGQPDVDRMTSVELELFNNLVRVLKTYRATALKGEGAAEEGPGPKAPEVPHRPEAPAAAGGGEPSQGAAPDGATAGEDDGAPALERVMVRVLEDLEPFVAQDMETYALAADDVVHLPVEQARVLCRRGKAVELPADAA